MIKFLIAILSAAVIFISSNADAACTSVSGTAEATDGVCTESPLGLCASGTFSGSINGDYVAVFQTLTPAPTLASPLRFAFTFNSTVTTSTGTLFQHESGYIVYNNTLGTVSCLTGCVSSSTPDACYASCLNTYGRTSFIQNMVPYAGTGSYSSIVDGLIVATGTGNYTDAVSTGDYSGQICDTVQ